jgi:hypothetical protein
MNMKLSLNELKLAMNIIHKQITERLLEHENSQIQLGLDAISELSMTYIDGILSIQGPLSEDINPKYPNWINFETDIDSFTISAKANPYSPELCFLLMEVWKEVKLNPSKSLAKIIEESLFFIEKRWNFNKEPIDRKNQRGLIGEIEALIEASKIKGLEAVDCWDHTSHATHDITGDGWAIEAKSIGKDSQDISISSLEQLQFSKGQKLILSVTTVSSEKDGLTFPSYIDKKLDQMMKINPDFVPSMDLKLQTIGYNESLRTLFTSKWKNPETEDTEFYNIDEKSPTNWWSQDKNPEKPDEILIKNYRLDISSEYFIAHSLEYLL